jgi:two-component system osmolarity sensor histidine kinase EnvZ
VAGEVAILVDMIEAERDEEVITQLSQAMQRNLSLYTNFEPGAELGINEGRNLPAHVVESLVVQSLKKELRGTLRRPFVVNIDFREKQVQIAVQLTKGVLHLDLPGRRLFSSSGYVFLLWMFSSSLILLFIAVLFMRNQVRPIRRLAVAAERFGKGRDAPNFKPSGAKEVRQAAQAFIDMRHRIQRQMEQRSIMLAGVSHDLRTPLTRLKLEIEMLKDHKNIEAMRADIQEMERMINGYLNFVRDESDEDMVFTSVPEFVERLVGAAKRQNISIHQKSALLDIGSVKIQPLAFERCMMNLINNAGQYAQNVWISAQDDGDSVTFVIEDDGEGIPVELYDDVFKPFFRADSARGGKSGSVGLGLPIAMDIVHRHGGNIHLDESEHGGLQVVLTLPK